MTLSWTMRVVRVCEKVPTGWPHRRLVLGRGIHGMSSVPPSVQEFVTMRGRSAELGEAAEEFRRRPWKPPTSWMVLSSPPRLIYSHCGEPIVTCPEQLDVGKPAGNRILPFGSLRRMALPTSINRAIAFGRPARVQVRRDVARQSRLAIGLRRQMNSGMIRWGFVSLQDIKPR
ncbi:hypothetical protein [Aureimonas pseudogalii]|uniref:Uncharacterized protein n=1 Tax=Aureimonas pseudogalii TaxID=1744844 RepID=A0A7W6MLW6_9HYPH|nr:hypothetical protein [Aureimonas pseudogalii]MBB4000227.1 hypothetical protein [Aureimonas pseudogalii]